MSMDLNFTPPKPPGPFRAAHGYSASRMKSKPALRLDWALLPTGETERASLTLERALAIDPQRPNGVRR